MKYANKSQFTKTLERIGIQKNSIPNLWYNLQRKYTQKDRHYHNLEHIENMLSELNRIGLNNDILNLAIWYHDSIYEPDNKQNEEDSAQYFIQEIGHKLTKEITDQITHLILATKLNKLRSGYLNEAIIVDIDLHTLGTPSSRYKKYQECIRKEYASIPFKKYTAGRIQILEKFLSHQILKTRFFEHLEPQARNNIKEELKTLKQSEY
jgi:predicted metal-dependent HD superfamily phosphohydrolase